MEVTRILIFVIAVAIISGQTTDAVDCSSLILNMADCLSFVTKGSTIEKPEGTCCSGLKTVVRSGPECLCEAFKNSASLGVTLDLSKASSLPSVCKVAAPPSARCGLSVSASPPATAPGLSPMAGEGAPRMSTGEGAPRMSTGENAATPVAPEMSPKTSDATLLSVFISSAIVMAISFFY